MCGICGVILKEGDAISLVGKIEMAQESRGRDSSGIAYINGEGDLKVRKKIINPRNFDWENGEKSRVAIGHNRMASIGEITIENAHPFKLCDGTFAFIHNGHYSEYENLKGFLDNDRHDIEGETDSEIIAHFIEEMKNIKGFLKTLKFVEGQRLLILTQKGEIWGRGDLVIIKDKAGIYIANEKEAFNEIFGGKRKRMYSLNRETVFHINKELKLRLFGEFEKVKTYIGKKHWYSGIISGDKNEEVNL